MKELYKFVYILLQKRLILLLAITASLASLFVFLSELIPKNVLALAGGIVASFVGATIAFSMAEILRFIRSKRTVFVSYTHADSDFVTELIRELSDLNIRFLVGRLELRVGDNIKSAVDNMIDAADCIIFVVSKDAIKSNWTKKELEQAISRKKKIFPVVRDKEAIPDTLSGIYFADFTEFREVGLQQLRKTLSRK